MPGSHRGGPTDPSHDENLRRGILHTDVSRAVAMPLVAAFLAIIGIVPVAQAVHDKLEGDEPVLLDLFRHVPTRARLAQMEEDLEKASTPREAVRPRVQLLFTRYGGFGNTKAVLGSQPGWLFYQPGIAAVGGPGLLDPEIQGARRKASLDDGDQLPVEPDPRPAILDFHRFLAGRGIQLVLFPIADKAGLQPAELHGRTGVKAAVAAGWNPDHARLMAELRAAGVLVFDPGPARVEPGARPRFLEQDTHWTPEFMAEVAGALGAFLQHEVGLPSPLRARHWQTAPVTVSRVGDVVDMLGLPEGQTLFSPRTITVWPVSDEAGAPFEPREDADVLLLGDSFTNVFTAGQMGWGESAGLAPTLARLLGRDLDVIAQNDAGAHATRKLLANALTGASAGADRLTGKKVVIWELASRELAVGDWKHVSWPGEHSAAPP